VALVLSVLADDNHLQLLSMTFAMVMISILLRSNEAHGYVQPCDFPYKLSPFARWCRNTCRIFV